MLPVIWYSLLLGIDGLAVSMALGPLTERRTRYVIASAFGVCDGAAVLLSPFASASFTATAAGSAARLRLILLLTYAVFVLLLARNTRKLTSVWGGWFLLPIATSIDNLATGVHLLGSDPTVIVAVTAALMSGGLSLLGLTSGAALGKLSELAPGRSGELAPRWLAVMGLLGAALLTR